MESSTQQEEIIAGAHKLLENLYDAHNVHFADPSRRSQLEGGIREIIAALPPDVSVHSTSHAAVIHVISLTDAVSAPAVSRSSIIYSW